jgi:predicted nucleic acid-binding protein
MTLLVDTSVWSLAFRRDGEPADQEARALREALANGDAIVTTGSILQELLQGFNAPRAQTKIVERFSVLPMITPDRNDHVEAAMLRNLCRRSGVQLGTIDALLAQLCLRHDLTMLSADNDFVRTAKHCPLKVWRAQPGSA